jgi:MoxR-like ATPase
MNALVAFEKRLQEELGAMVLGLQPVIRALAIAVVGRGHVLLQGAPGLGKTLLSKSLATSLRGVFKRVQGTSDLMPADITGVNAYDGEQRQFVFRPGPVFADVLLVDEINRAGPKTQSALLEAMEERQVTVDRQNYALPKNFLVVATQNPREFEGTFPLPESQLDRFMLRLRIGYPAPADEQRILRDREYRDPLDHLQPVMNAAEVVELQQAVASVSVDDVLVQYLMRIVAATRDSEMLDLGVSPRGTLALFRASQALALGEDRMYCIPDDIKRLVVPVFAHRIVVSSRFSSSLRRSEEAEAVLTEILKTVSVPL